MSLSWAGHRFRLLYRDADGLPEEHDKIVDVDNRIMVADCAVKGDSFASGKPGVVREAARERRRREL